MNPEAPHNAKQTVLPRAMANPLGRPVAGICAPSTPLNVFLVDERQLHRDSIGMLIRAIDPLMTVAGVAAPEELKVASEENGLPTVVCANFCGMGTERLPWVDQISARLPKSVIGVLAEGDDAVAVRAMLDRGVRGVIPPSTPGDVFVSALRMLAAGGTYIPSTVLWSDPATTSDAAGGACIDQLILRRFAMLSARQATVLRLLAQGRTNDQIAETLSISGNTVRVHVHNIFRKLKIHRRRDAARLIDELTAADRADG